MSHFELRECSCSNLTVRTLIFIHHLIYLKSFINYNSQSAIFHPCSIALIALSLLSIGYCFICSFDVFNLNIAESEKFGIFNFENLFKGSKPFIELLSECYTVLFFAFIFAMICLNYSLVSQGVDGNIMNGACFAAFIFYSSNVFSRILLVKETKITEIPIHREGSVYSLALFIYDELSLYRLIDAIKSYIAGTVTSLSVIKYSEISIFESRLLKIICILALPLTTNEWFNYPNKDTDENCNSELTQKSAKDSSDDSNESNTILSSCLARSLLVLITTCYCLQSLAPTEGRYYLPVISYYSQMIFGTAYYLYKIQVSDD